MLALFGLRNLSLPYCSMIVLLSVSFTSFFVCLFCFSHTGLWSPWNWFLQVLWDRLPAPAISRGCPRTIYEKDQPFLCCFVCMLCHKSGVLVSVPLPSEFSLLFHWYICALSQKHTVFIVIALKRSPEKWNEVKENKARYSVGQVLTILLLQSGLGCSCLQDFCKIRISLPHYTNTQKLC